MSSTVATFVISIDILDSRDFQINFRRNSCKKLMKAIRWRRDQLLDECLWVMKLESLARHQCNPLNISILFFIFFATPSLFCGQLLEAFCGRLISPFPLFYVRTQYSTIIYPVFLLLEISLRYLLLCTVLYTVRVCVYACVEQYRQILTSSVLYTVCCL